MSLTTDELDKDAILVTPSFVLSIPELDAPTKIDHTELPGQTSDPKPSVACHAADSLDTALQTLSISEEGSVRSSDAGPFLQPVDHVQLAIPMYPIIIKRPMDLGTVERKAQASNPVKPDLNSVVGLYSTVDEFIADVRLIVANCLKFNGSDSPISEMGKWLGEKFDEFMKELPPTEGISLAKGLPTPRENIDG
ncbi:Bromodomain-containing protein [Auricularia subglabra TFB-10046 SS5]|nr:Bromodomain-containing protein [Auricularia subglabra TFB-10046 SS5]